MTTAEKQRYRNQISAQKSRLKKKEETIFLNRIVREKDSKYQEIISVLDKMATDD